MEEGWKKEVKVKLKEIEKIKRNNPKDELDVKKSITDFGAQLLKDFEFDCSEPSAFMGLAFSRTFHIQRSKNVSLNNVKKKT